MDRRIIRNFLLFLVIVSTIFIGVSCQQTPINKSVTITFSGDDNVRNVSINDKNSSGITDKNIKYTQKAGETFSFDVETDALYMVKSISGQVSYRGGKTYAMAPTENTEVSIETVRRVSSDPLFSVRGDSGVETVTFKENGETSTVTRIATSATAFFEKAGSGTLTIRPKSGYKIENVRGASLLDATKGEYAVSDKSVNVIVTTTPDTTYVNTYKTIVINNQGGEGETSVIFFKDGKFYDDNKDGNREITSIPLPTYGDYVVSFIVGEKDIVIDKGEGVEGEVIGADYTLPAKTNFVNIVSSNNDEAIDDNGNIKTSVTPFSDCVEYKAVWSTEEIELPTLRQNLGNKDEYTKRFLGWGLKQNDPTVDLKATDGSLTIPYTPNSTIKLYDKWVNETYTLKINITGETNGKLIIVRDREEEYKNGDVLTLSKQRDLIFRLIPNDTYTSTHSLTDDNDSNKKEILFDNQNQSIGEFLFKKETVNKYSSLTLNVKFGRFADAELSGNIALVKNVEIDDKNYATLPSLTLRVDPNNTTHDTWDDNKLRDKVDITDKVFIGSSSSTSQNPLTYYGETLKAYLTYDGSDNERKRAIVSIEGTPTISLASNSIVYINTLPMSYLSGVSENDSLTIKSIKKNPETDEDEILNSAVIKDSVMFTFSKVSDENNIKNRFTGIVIDKTDLIKERTLQVSENGTISFSAEKDTNLIFTPLFETGFALDYSNRFVDSNVNVGEAGDKFVVYASEYSDSAKDSVSLSVTSREKSIVVSNIDVVDEGLRNYNVGDNSSKIVRIELQNNGYENSVQGSGVEPLISVLINENSEEKWVDIKDRSIGGVGFTWTFNVSGNIFTISLRPNGTLTLPLSVTSLKIAIPSRAFDGETSDVEVLYKDNKPEIPFIIYPSTTLSGAMTVAENISDDRVKDKGQITLSSESALNSGLITENGYDITEYVTVGNTNEPLSSFALKATLFVDKVEGDEGDATLDVKTGHIAITGTASKALDESLLNFPLPAKLFKGFEGDEKTLRSTSNAKLNILKTISLTFSAAEDDENGQKNKLSSVIINDSATLKGETLDVSSNEGRTASVYTIEEETIRFSLTFEESYALDNLDPFSPEELVTKVSSETDQTVVYEINGVNLKEDTELIISSSFKTVALENTTLSPYNVGDTSSKTSEFTLVASGYTLTGVTVTPTISVDITDRNGNVNTVPISRSDVGGVGFNVVDFVKQGENTFKLTISPRNAITTSLAASRIKITIPRAAFTNADSDVEVSGLNDKPLIIYPRFNASGDVTTVKGIGDEDALTSRVYTLTSRVPSNLTGTPWSDDKVGENEANGKDITSFVKIGENEISTYGLSAIMYFDASLTTKTTAKVAIKGAPNTALTKSDVSFELDSSFFRGFEDSSDEVQRTSEATLEVKDSVNLTIKASSEEIGTTDQIDSITLSATSYVKERTQNISTADDKTATIVIEKDRAIEFEPKIKTGFALDNNEPFIGLDTKPNANNKYQIPPQQADYTLTIKTIEMSVTATELSELEFNVGDGTNVKKQIPLMVKGYVLSDTFPSSARPTVFVSVVDTDIKEDITKTNGVGGRGFSATIAKNGNGIVLTISPKSTLNASYKMSKISVTLPRTIFTNANEDVVVSGDNIDKIRFVVYPSYSTSSDVKLINGVNSADLTVSPEIIITSDTKWKTVAEEGEDITDKVFIGGTVLSEYNLNARLTTNASENDGKTARVVIEGTPNKDTKSISEPITIKIDATMLEGYGELGEKEINCRQSAATLLVEKSVELKFKTPDLAIDGNNEDARKLKSVFVRADGLKDKEYALVNGEVSIFVKESKNVTFKPTYEVGYAGSSTPFASSVSVVNSGDSNFPYRVVLQNVVLENKSVIITGTSILKNVMASNPSDLTFRVSSSSSSDVKTLTFTVDGYELADSIVNVEPRIYAFINSEEVLLTDDTKKDLLGGTGFNVSMQKRTDGVVGLTIQIAPKDRLTQHLELSKIKVVLPISTFKNESDGVEDVVVSGLDNTNIVIYPSVSATGGATLVQNVSTDELIIEPVVSLTSDAMWEIQDEGEDIKDLLSVNNQSLSRATLISSALLVKDGTDSTGKTALIKFSGTPTEAIPTLTSLAYAFDSSYFAGKFTEDVDDPVSISVPSNSSRIAVYPAQKITFNVPSLVTTTDGDNEDTRKLKSVNVRQSENIKGRTITLNDAKEAVVYVQRAKALNAVLTFEGGYSLSSNNAYSTSPIIEVRGLGTDGNPLTIADNILSSDTTITVTSIKQGITLSEVSPSSEKGVEYTIGDTSSKAYDLTVKMVGYTKGSRISGNPRVMIRTTNGELINITNTSVGGVGFNVSSVSSPSDGFTITISPKATLTSPLPNGTLVVYIPSSYIEGATSDIEVVGGENLRSFNIYPTINLSGTVNLVKGINTNDLVAETTFKLVSDAPFSESYIASSRLVTPPSTSIPDDPDNPADPDNKEVGESYMLSNSDISEYMTVSSDSFQSYGNSAKISIDSSDNSGKTAIITISGVSTKVLSSLSDVNVSLPISYFSDYVQGDEPIIKATSTAKMDINDSVPLIFKKNITSEDKGKLTKVTVSSTDRIKEVSHTFTSTEDTFETSVESSVATRFTLEHEKGYYIDTYAPFNITPSVEITNVDNKLTTFEIAASTLKSSTVITVNTVKQQVIMDGVLEGYFEYFIGDSTDTKLVISSHVAGLVIKDNVTGIVPTANLNVNGNLTDITSPAIGGVGFNAAIEKRTDRDGFLITLSPKGPITESLVVSELTITLPKTLFENGDADYNLDNLDSSMIFYPSATATGSVNLYYFEEIPEDTIVTLTSETPWSSVVIGNELDITDLILIGSYNGKKLKDYGETLKAMLSIDPSDSFKKTALVKFSGIPQVLQKEPQKVLFDFTPNLFSGFEGEDFLLDPTSSVEFSVVESPNRSAFVNAEDVGDITYSVSSEASSEERVFRVAMNGYMLSEDDISSILPLIYVVNGDEETLISDASIGGAGFNVSMAKNDEGNGVNITLSPKGAFTSSLELSKIKVVLPASTFKNQVADVSVNGFENTNIVIYPGVTARGEVKFVQNISDTLLNAEPIVTLTSTSPWSSNIPSSGKEIKGIISLEGDTNLLSLFGDDFKATLTKDDADIEGKTAFVKFSGTPISSLNELTALNYTFDTSYFDGTFVSLGGESGIVSVVDNTSKLIISPSHKVTFKIPSETNKDKLTSVSVLKSENIKERKSPIDYSSKSSSVYAEDSKTLEAVLEFEGGYSLSPDNPYVATPEITVTGQGTAGDPMKIASGVITKDIEIVVSSVQKSIYLSRVSNNDSTVDNGIEYSVGDTTTKSYVFDINLTGYDKATNISGTPIVEIRKADGSRVDITKADVGGVGFNVTPDTNTSGIRITISPKDTLTASLPTGSVVITIPQSFIKDATSDIEVVVSNDKQRSFKILPSFTVSGNVSLVKDVADTSLRNSQTFTLTSETPFASKNTAISSLVNINGKTLKDYGTTLKATYKRDANDKKKATLTITGTPTVALTTSSTVSINQLPLTYFEGFEAETNRINSTSSSAKMDISDSITLTVRKNSSDADKGKITKVVIGATSRIKGVTYNISPTSTGIVRKIVEKGVAQHFTFAYDNDYFIDDTAPFTTSPSIAITKSDGKLYEYDIASDVLTSDTSITVNTVKKAIVFDGTDDALKFKIGDDGEVKATINTLLNGLIIKEDIKDVVPTITIDGKDITESIGGVGFNVALSKRIDGENGFTLELSPSSALTESLVLSSINVSLPSSLFENDTRETVKDYDVEDIASSLIIYPSITATGNVETIINREIESDTTIKFTSETAFSEGNVRLNGDITTLVTIGNGDESKPLTDYGKGLSAKMTIDPTDENNKTVIVTFRGTPQTLLQATVMNFNLNASFFAGFESEKEAITTNSSAQFIVNEVPGDPIPLITVNGKDLTHSSMKDTTLSVTIPEEYANKDLYLIISNPQYDSLPSPKLSGYEIPTTKNNLLSEYMSPFAVDMEVEDEYCDTSRMEEEFQKALEEEQYVLMAEAMSNDYAISTQAANETVDTIWKNPFENLEVGEQVFLNDEKYLTPSTPEPKPGLYRTSKNGYEKVPASLRYKKKVLTPNNGEKELLIVVEDDMWGDDVVFSDPEIKEHFNTAYAKIIADQFLSNGTSDIYGNLINFYGDEWGIIPNSERVRDYYRSKRKDGTTYSDNGEYIGVTNQIVLFFARLDGATDLSGSNTLGYYNAGHLRCNSTKYIKSNQSVCLTINAFNALNDLNRCTSTCAHEFQHAIYNYQRKMSKGYDPNGQYINTLVNNTTEPWVNEMFSTLVQDTVSTILKSGPASYNDKGMVPAPASAYGGRIPSYFTAQRYGLTDWRRIQNVYSPNNTAITYGLVYSFGSYIVRNYGKGLNNAKGEYGFIKKYLASKENEFPSAADMPSESNGWSNSKSNALNMIIQAIRDSDPEYENVTWEEILQGWAAAILLSDKEDAKVPYKLVKNNGSDYWWNGVYDYEMKIPSINYFNYIGSSATLWEGGGKVRTTGPIIFNSSADRTYDMLPQGNQFYGNTNTYVLLGKGLSSGTHTYTVDGDTTYKYGLVLK